MRERLRDMAYRPKPPPISWLQAGVALGVGSARIGARCRCTHLVYLVHQPGKVGSSSLVSALGRVATDASVLHAHRLSPRARRRELGQRMWKPWAPRLMWGEAPAMRWAAMRRPADTVIVTAVRNPIEREISAVLQNPDRFLSTSRRLTEAEDLLRHRSELAQVVNARLATAVLDTWFEEELEYVIRQPVPWSELSERLIETGHVAFTSALGTRVHLLRFEDLEVGWEALSEEAGLTTIALPHENRSTAKVAADLLREDGLDPAAVGSALAQRVITASYSSGQIDAWRAEWT